MPKAQIKEEVEIVKAEVEPVKVAVLPKISVKPKREKTYSFEQWAQIRKKLPRHMRGMKAFLGSEVGSYKYTLEKWDTVFKTY